MALEKSAESTRPPAQQEQSAASSSRDTVRQRPGLRRGRLMAVVAALVGTLGSLLVTAPAQAAAGDLSYVLDQTNVRVCGSLRPLWCGSSYNGVMGSVSGHQWDQTWCWRDGEEALGTVRWFKVTAWTDNGWKTGWVSAALVPVQASVPWCSSWQ